MFKQGSRSYTLIYNTIYYELLSIMNVNKYNKNIPFIIVCLE